MIRFVDLTEAYWTHPAEGHPICAFLSTVNDRFIEDVCGEHTFDRLEDIAEHELGERLVGLVPDGFFTTKGQTDE